jgi:hypothetical protein
MGLGLVQELLEKRNALSNSIAGLAGHELEILLSILPSREQ